MIIWLFLPMFFFNPFNLGMTGVTIITSSANMCSPLVTVYTFLVLWIGTIGCKILVHDLVKVAWFMKIKYGVSPGEGEVLPKFTLYKVYCRSCGWSWCTPSKMWAIERFNLYLNIAACSQQFLIDVVFARKFIWKELII